MRILIVFGSTEGHTEHLARFAGQCLGAAGHQATVAPAADAPAPEGEDAVIVAASLHAGRYQPAVVDYVRGHAAALSARRSAFLAVSLSAAGHDHDDWAGLEQCVARLEEETGWTPAAVHHAAGAFTFSRYNFLTRQLMKHIARKRGLDLDPRRDHDLTDYEALRRFVLGFAGSATVKAA